MTSRTRPRIIINGRFLDRRATGVDRVASRVLAELDKILATDPFADVVIAAPARVRETPSFDNIGIEKRGFLSGVLWEQIDLPAAYRGDIIVNLCNTAPALHSRNIVVMHDALVFDEPQSYAIGFRYWYKALLPRLAARALRVVTVSRFSAQRLRANGVTPAGADAMVIYNGGDHLTGGERADKPADVARPYVLFVGSPVAHKNLALFCNVAKAFEERLDFVVVGAADAGVFATGGGEQCGPNVRFEGYVSGARLRELYQGALCLAFPSRTEGFGFPPIEAMSLDCPVVSSSSAVMPEILGEAPLYAAPDRPDQWIAAIEAIGADPALRASLVARGRTCAGAYRWRDTGAAYAQMLKAALSGDRAPVAAAPVEMKRPDIYGAAAAREIAPETIQPDGSLRVVAAKGLAVLAAQSMLSRVVLFGSQIALGWLLTPADFGIVAIASIVTSLAWTIIGFGVDSVLLQRSRTMEIWEKTAFAVGLGQGILALVVVAATAPFFAFLFKSPELIAPLLLFALGMPIAGIILVPTARAFARLAFGWVATINIVDLLVAQILTVLFAFWGFGALSFFLPIPIAFAVRAALFWSNRPQRLRGRITRRKINILLHRGSMVFGSRIFSTFMTQGDYFVLALFAAKQAVGFYFFAFRLAAVPIRIIAANVQNILFPMLARMRGDPERQAVSARNAAQMLSYLVTPLCILQAALAEPVLVMLFGAKWAPSIILLQVLSLGLPAEAVAAVARAQLDAVGAFGRTLKYTLAGAAVFFGLVTIGAAWGGALGVATAVATYYLVTQPSIFFRVFPARGHLLRDVMRIFVAPMLVSLAAVGAGVLASSVLFAPEQYLARALTIMLLSGALYIGLVRLAGPATFADLLRLFGQLLEKVPLPRRGKVLQAR